MNFEIEMFFDPHLRVLIEAPTNLLSREVPEWKCPMDLPTSAAIL